MSFHSRTIWILGTDTGVGKTVVTAAIARCLTSKGLQVAALKPIASGIDPESSEVTDAAMLAAACDQPELADLDGFIRLREAVTPQTAAEIEGRTLNLEVAFRAVQQVAADAHITLIEGVGGVAVPIVQNVLCSDLAKNYGTGTAILVARSALGTINHTVLTVEHLRAKGVTVLGIIFVRSEGGELSLAESTGPDLVSQLTTIPNWGLVDFIPGLEDCKTPAECVALLPAESAAIETAATELIRLG